MWPPLRHSGAALGALVGIPVWGVAMLASPRWRERPGERLGRAPRVAAGALWVHGASVGEILAATRLLDALGEAGWPVLASTMTETGQAVLARARPEVPRTLAPFDHPWCVGRALARVRPRALVLIETELWPSWIAAATRARIPVLLVSARLSDRSFGRYRRLAAVMRPTLLRLAAVGARSDEDAERFRHLGVPEPRVTVTGDLKLEPPGRETPLPADLRAVLGESRPLMAASTHAGEEETILEAWTVVQRERLAAPLVLAPRHPGRADEVASRVSARGHPVRRRSELGSEVLRPDQVLLLDTVGELPGLLPHASVVFVGGSLAPVGGHNVVEPAWVGRPVLFGPHMENWRVASEALLAVGGGRRVAGAAELARAWVDLLRDPTEAKRMGETARREVERHQGATRRTLARIESQLAAGGEGDA